MDEKVLAALSEALRPLGAYLDTPEEEFAQLLHDAGWTLVRRDAPAVTEPDCLPFPMNDATKWVRAFRGAYPDCNVPDDVMLDWFAAAIEHGRGPADLHTWAAHIDCDAGSCVVADLARRAPAATETDLDGACAYECPYKREAHPDVADHEYVAPAVTETALDLDTFIAGLDSPNHSPESRRDWCALFFRDMKRAALAAPAVTETMVEDAMRGGYVAEVPATLIAERLNAHLAAPAVTETDLRALGRSVRAYMAQHEAGCDCWGCVYGRAALATDTEEGS